MDACWQCGALLSPLSLAAPSPDFSCVTCGARLADTPSLGLSEAIADQMMLYSGLACVTVPAWSDSVTDHGQEYVTELVSGSLRGTNPANAADRLRAVTLEAWQHRKAFARWKARRQRRGTTRRTVRPYATATLPGSPAGSARADSVIAAKAPSWCSRTTPSRASSNPATNVLATAERRHSGSLAPSSDGASGRNRSRGR